ncbi:MAG TPA: DUF5985 family protein [Humisphaera sp.]|jgi:hypothetical protein|nr:DUF5985 family protein [Humisphaera sp.]
MANLDAFLLGVLVMACAASSLFFLRFWRRTRDRLFAIFATAFLLMGANWALLLCTHGDESRYSGLYLLRLVAYLLILLGIADKNRSRRGL